LPRRCCRNEQTRPTGNNDGGWLGPAKKTRCGDGQRYVPFFLFSPFFAFQSDRAAAIGSTIGAPYYGLPQAWRAQELTQSGPSNTTHPQCYRPIYSPHHLHDDHIKQYSLVYSVSNYVERMKTYRFRLSDCCSPQAEAARFQHLHSLLGSIPTYFKCRGNISRTLKMRQSAQSLNLFLFPRYFFFFFQSPTPLCRNGGPIPRRPVV
jgi:hypothetical protein